MNNLAMFKMSYGLYVLSARVDNKDNGCIINTAMQITDTPKQIIIGVNKQNLTHDMIMQTKAFNLSMLDQRTPFSVFQNFGFQSGKTVDKFKDVAKKRSENGIAYLVDTTNAYLAAKVIATLDVGTHTIFIAEVTEAEVLSDQASVTYSYYQEQIKPAPKKEIKKGWRCKICGYVYEGDELPEDYICPICKHGASDFERIES